ncbi:hypothetical protein CPC08DRAFT_727845 [Agrocybe pediades]|nr:hypothetical protein CPC08DRAFT_727845 [Agrocybe pediades]
MYNFKQTLLFLVSAAACAGATAIVSGASIQDRDVAHSDSSLSVSISGNALQKLKPRIGSVTVPNPDLCRILAYVCQHPLRHPTKLSRIVRTSMYYRKMACQTCPDVCNAAPRTPAPH